MSAHSSLVNSNQTDVYHTALLPTTRKTFEATTRLIINTQNSSPVNTNETDMETCGHDAAVPVRLCHPVNSKLDMSKYSFSVNGKPELSTHSYLLKVEQTYKCSFSVKSKPNMSVHSECFFFCFFSVKSKSDRLARSVLVNSNQTYHQAIMKQQCFQS